MYLPDSNVQAPLLDTASLPPIPPNVTKGVHDLLDLCDAAGLDKEGSGCAAAIGGILILLAALLLIIVVVVVPAILGLFGGIITALGGVIAAVIAGVTAVFLGLIAGFIALFAVLSRTLLNILFFPFRPCMRNKEPDSPLLAPDGVAVVAGQIHYTRSREESDVHPPSYHSDEEYPRQAAGK